MAECRDIRFERLLHAWELGMLSDTDSQELEQHLMDCQSCFEKANKLESAARLILRDSDVQDTIADMAGETSASPPPSTTQSVARKPGFFNLARISMAAAAVLIILLLKPWQLELRRSDDAVAAESRLAIMYFNNLSDVDDTERLGAIVSSLLITDLSESHYVEVVSSQRIQDILNLLDYEGSQGVSPQTATLVAERAGARWMLSGSLIHDDSSLIITAELTDVSTGNVEASQRVTGARNESIFSLVDNLTVEIKNDLSLPLGAYEEPDPMVAEVTTDSPEAYRQYLEGIELASQMLIPRATECFTRAVELDSTFAMACYYLSEYSGLEKRTELIKRAVRYSDKVSHRERLMIKSREAQYAGDGELALAILIECGILFPEDKIAQISLGIMRLQRREFHTARVRFEEALRLDPLYKKALNQLAYTYNGLGDFDNAIKTLDRYQSIAPEEVNPYDSRAEILALNGFTVEAIAAYRQALEINPDFYASKLGLGHMLVLTGQYDLAAETYRSLESSTEPRVRAAARYHQHYIPLRQGKYLEALEALDKALEDDIEDRGVEDTKVRQEDVFRRKAHLFAAQGLPLKALAATREAIRLHLDRKPDEKGAYQCRNVQFLAESGQLGSADSASQKLLEDIERGKADFVVFWQGRAAIARASGDYDGALDYYRKAAQYNLGFPAQFALGRACYESGEIKEAIGIFEKLLLVRSERQLDAGAEAVRCHYYLGLSHEQEEQFEKAVVHYETFLDILRNADAGLPFVDDARRRVAKLKTRS